MLDFLRYDSAGHKKPPVDKKRRMRLLRSYIPDWIITIGLWAVFYALDKIIGYRRLFSITDESLQHPYAEHERVPVYALALIAGVFPLLVILVTAALITRSFWDAHNGVLGLALSLGLTVTFTDIVKITVGRPRPDLISRCVPPPGYTSNPTLGLTSWTICTRTDLLNEGFRSFPSGHASFSWAGMVFLLLYVAGKMHIYNKKGYTVKSWILLIPITAASLVTISRSMDYRHHPGDLFAGSLIGILVAWYCYRQFYPSLASTECHRPYSPRIPRDATNPTQRLDDDHVGLPLHSNPNHDVTATSSTFADQRHEQLVGRPSAEPLTAKPAPLGVSGSGGGRQHVEGANGNGYGYGYGFGEHPNGGMQRDVTVDEYERGGNGRM